MHFLADIEQSGFATWVRESDSLLAYPTILFAHTVGLGLLVGMSMAIDLRLLGFAPTTSLAPMRKFFPIMFIGFWISAISGLALAAADATTMLVNPVFIVKMAFIVLGMVNVRIIWKRVFGSPEPEKNPFLRARLLAGTSLFLWVCAITAGRLTAYLGQTLPQ
jgi:hypothetical protein